MSAGVEINSIEVVATVDSHVIMNVGLTVAAESSIEAIQWLVGVLDG
jgi:hypothetical protein